VSRSHQPKRMNGIKTARTYPFHQSYVEPLFDHFLFLPRFDFDGAVLVLTFEQDYRLLTFSGVGHEVGQPMTLRGPPVVSIAMKSASQGSPPDNPADGLVGPWDVMRLVCR